jgi:hypothetical protein
MMEDLGLKDGDWENRLIWKLKTREPWRDAAKKKRKKKKEEKEEETAWEWMI